MARIFSRSRSLVALLAALIASPAWAAGDKAKKDEKWDVDNPPDETYEIEIDTAEGTWTSVDVSPDGKQIVFDLLGDLFVMPIAGGDAKPLTSGLAWDMQPRFSPDGRHIAYTSDRGGGDNIWIINSDGSEPKQISKESFRLLNNPTWSPDGQYIAARKHFTKTRSLGAGEIWLYHRAGGKGLQLIKKPNDQKDLGEPAFSPDGRYLYYSRDATPGSTFQYSKDPTPGIYSVMRLDRRTGDVETYVSGMGGAIRPTPSPDGKSLAFIRRHDYDTALYLHDIASGKNTLLTKKLDRDMQETWAIHGVYANIAWTPDNRYLVFWAGGKIHKIDVASKAVAEIPFRVKTKHTMVKPLRFPVAVAPDEFDVKMLRWIQVSPNQDQAVFQALGRLYVKDLPDGEPRRLTGQNDHFEHYPSYSRDGKWIVYTAWDDEELGSIRVVSAKGGEGRAVTDQPGHYLEPAFSPDGAAIAYRKTGGGYITSPLWSKEPGIYVIPTQGGAAKRVAKRGAQPHFGASGDRLFYVTVDQDLKRTMRSVNLNGFEARAHVELGMGLEMEISPDGKWVAFIEGFKAYIAPFVATGKTYRLGPKATNVPVRQVSKEAGENLHWNAAGDRLYWSMGDTLYHRDLKDAFAFLEGAPEKAPEPVSKGARLGFKARYDRPSGALALVGARIVTMKGDEVIEDGAIVVEGNRIKALGKRGDTPIPRNAKTIDVSGKTIIPGLVDVHAHGPYGSNEIVPQQNWSLYAGLTFGVTTIHDPSSDTSTIFAAAEMAKANMILAPRIFSTGTILYGATVPGFTAKINSAEDAAFHLRRMQAAGAITVKSYNQPRRDQRQQVVAEARKLGMMVVPEGGSLFQHNMTMIADGHTGIEHSIPVADAYDDVAQFWSQSETYYTPTLVVGYGGIWGERYWYEKTDVWRHEKLSKFAPPFVLDPASRRREKAPQKEYNHYRNAALCKKLLDAGVPVLLGAHGQREGLAAHWEIWMFAQGGMTPMEALRCGTLYPAKYLGLDGDVGSLEKGKLADLAVLGKNPLDNIRHSETVTHVMLNGRLFEADTMNEIGNHPQARAPLFWRQEGADSPSAAVHAEIHGAHKCGGFCRQ